eukprot:3248798-Pleurochrysis_carterae.AAC.3
MSIFLPQHPALKIRISCSACMILTAHRSGRAPHAVPRRGSHLAATRWPCSAGRRRLLPADLHARYEAQILRRFLAESRSWHPCPRADCANIVHCAAAHATAKWSAPLGESAVPAIDVQCLCGHRFCFNCRRRAHQPLRCEMVLAWQARTKAGAIENQSRMHWRRVTRDGIARTCVVWGGLRRLCTRRSPGCGGVNVGKGALYRPSIGMQGEPWCFVLLCDRDLRRAYACSQLS